MISTKKIKELNFSDQIYFIPSYQRGYRWEEKQVVELLDDIYEVYKTEQKSYSLQPIVVSEIEPNKFTIIDGQQRLTTIYILLTRLKKFTSEKFQLDFEVRTNCVDFLEKLDQGVFNYNNPDFAHISNAYLIIDKWFSEKIANRIDSNIEMNMFQTLLEKVEVIWYDVEEKQREKLINIFTRLNSGKVPLTNAELVKALFLGKTKHHENSKDIFTTKLDISNKWNQIEYALQNDEFWNFINNSHKVLPTRIDYIFQLIVKDKNVAINDEYDVFRYYYSFYFESLQNGDYNFATAHWPEVDLYYTILDDWYTNHEHYHLIGLLIWDGMDVLTLINEYQHSNKSHFTNYLFGEIEIRFCGIPLNSLYYNGKPKEVERMLVFFNVMEASKPAAQRFPFKKLKLKEIKWSLEHIHPQNAQVIKQSEYVQWLNDHLVILKHGNLEHCDDLITEIESFVNDLQDTTNKKLDKSQFDEISAKILNCLTYVEIGELSVGKKSGLDYAKLGNEHHISNMALLDTSQNSSLGNSAFSVKRKSIIDFELKGDFVPGQLKTHF